MFSRRYFVRLRVGEERRDPGRLNAEGQVALGTGAVVYGLAGSAAFLMFGVFCFFYLLKSMLGVNIFGDASPLHPLYALFFN